MVLLAQGPGLGPSVSSVSIEVAEKEIVVVAPHEDQEEEALVVATTRGQKEQFRLGYEAPLCAVAPIFLSVWIQ